MSAPGGSAEVFVSPTGLVTLTIRTDVPDDQFAAAVAELSAAADTLRMVADKAQAQLDFEAQS